MVIVTVEFGEVKPHALFQAMEYHCREALACSNLGGAGGEKLEPGNGCFVLCDKDLYGIQNFLAARPVSPLAGAQCKNTAKSIWYKLFRDQECIGRPVTTESSGFFLKVMPHDWPSVTFFLSRIWRSNSFVPGKIWVGGSAQTLLQTWLSNSIKRGHGAMDWWLMTDSKLPNSSAQRW